jgi:hypothetical protein
MVSATHEHQGHHDNHGERTAAITVAEPGASERDAEEDVGSDELGGWSDERLEDGLTTLAGQIAAATCRFLLLLAEYDRRRAWARWDCVSAEQWLSWRCQIDPRTAREHLRVAHRLTALPGVADARVERAPPGEIDDAGDLVIVRSYPLRRVIAPPRAFRGRLAYKHRRKGRMAYLLGGSRPCS